jgi:glycosyltransferase involved in cell wall biosynthesis
MEVLRHAAEFDIIHSHLEWTSLSLAAASPVPVVSTFHGRLDWPFAHDLLRGQTGLVAISRSQASAHPEVPWEGIVHNGLTLVNAPFERRRGDDLVFVGRIEPEKGVLDAMEIARLSGRRLRIAAKVGTTPSQRAYHEDVFLPALEEAGSSVEFLGEVDPETRDRLLAEAYACLIPATWPEPFGLVTIESLACGTPVIARRVGALPEVIRDGIDGFFGDDPGHMAFLLDRVADLDRAAIRESAIERFSPARMTDRYETIYERSIRAGRRLRTITRPIRSDEPPIVGVGPGVRGATVAATEGESRTASAS